MKKNKLRRIIKIVTPLLTFSMLAGMTVNAEGEKKHIVLLTESYTDYEAEGFRKYVLEPFAEAYPDIEIEWQMSADHREVIKVQMAAGSGPDIFLLDGPAVAQEYYAAERILDLTPYSEKYGWEEQFYSWALDCATFDERLWAVPISYEGIVWWYNESMFEENGWEIPKNREEFEAFCETVQEAGIIPMSYGASNIKIANDWIATQYIAAVCGKEETRKVLTGETKWTDDPMRTAIQTMVDDWKNGWIGNKQSQSISQDDATSLLFQRMAATKPEGSWMYSTVSAGMNEGSTEDKINVTLFPSFIEGNNPVFPLGIGAAYCVNANTEYPDECAEFLNFMTCGNMENHAREVIEYGWQPVPVNSLNEYLTEGSMPELLQTMMSTMDDAMKNNDINFVAYTFWPSEVRNFFNDNIEKVYLDMMTLDDFLVGMQETFDKAADANLLLPIPE